MSITFNRALWAVMDAATEMGFRPTERAVLGGDRLRRNTIIRGAVCWLLREHTRMSLADIGSRMGKHHSSVIHIVRSTGALMRSDPIVGNLMLRSCQLLGVAHPPGGLCVKEPVITSWNRPASEECPGSVRTSRSEWRLPRPWMGEDAESFREWAPSGPVAGGDGGYVVPLNWTKDERIRLDRWREDTRGAIGSISTNAVGFGRSGKARTKTPEAHRQ